MFRNVDFFLFLTLFGITGLVPLLLENETSVFRSKPPKIIERRTVLKSVHVYKKHKVQYEARTHFRSIEVSGIVK